MELGPSLAPLTTNTVELSRRQVQCNWDDLWPVLPNQTCHACQQLFRSASVRPYCLSCEARMCPIQGAQRFLSAERPNAMDDDNFLSAAMSSYNQRMGEPQLRGIVDAIAGEQMGTKDWEMVNEDEPCEEPREDQVPEDNPREDIIQVPEDKPEWLDLSNTITSSSAEPHSPTLPTSAQCSSAQTSSRMTFMCKYGCGRFRNISFNTCCGACPGRHTRECGRRQDHITSIMYSPPLPPITPQNLSEGIVHHAEVRSIYSPASFLSPVAPLDILERPPAFLHGIVSDANMHDDGGAMLCNMGSTQDGTKWQDHFPDGLNDDLLPIIRRVNHYMFVHDLDRKVFVQYPKHPGHRRLRWCFVIPERPILFFLAFANNTWHMNEYAELLFKKTFR